MSGWVPSPTLAKRRQTCTRVYLRLLSGGTVRTQEWRLGNASELGTVPPAKHVPGDRLGPLRPLPGLSRTRDLLLRLGGGVPWKTTRKCASSVVVLPFRLPRPVSPVPWSRPVTPRPMLTRMGDPVRLSSGRVERSRRYRGRKTTPRNVQGLTNRFGPGTYTHLRTEPGRAHRELQDGSSSQGAEVATLSFLLPEGLCGYGVRGRRHSYDGTCRCPWNVHTTSIPGVLLSGGT